MNVQYLYNGTDITRSVISADRSQAICTGIGSLRLATKLNAPVSFQLYNTLVVYEEGVKKGTYFIHTIDKDVPTATLTLNAQDASLKLQDYYIAENYVIDYPSTSDYWIKKFLTEATVSYNFTSSQTGSLLNNNTALGMATAYDTIVPLLQQNGWYMYFNEENIAQIGKLTVDTGSYAETFTDTQILSINGVKHDRMFRNRIVVWGSGSALTGRWAYYDLDNHGKYANEYPGGSDVRTVVVANSNIKTVGEASVIAYRALKEFEKTNDETTIQVAGAYDLHLGDYIYINSAYKRTSGIITTLGSSVSSGGLITEIVINQRCPRLFAWYDYGGYVYIGTDGDGVWRKPLKYNHTWTNFSTGLTDLHIHDLAVDSGNYGAVSLAGDFFVRFPDTNWRKITLNPTFRASGTPRTFSDSEVECTACTINKFDGEIVGIVSTVSGCDVGRGWVYFVKGPNSVEIKDFQDSDLDIDYRLHSVDIDTNGGIFITATPNISGAAYVYNAGSSFSSSNNYIGYEPATTASGYSVYTNLDTNVMIEGGVKIHGHNRVNAIVTTTDNDGTQAYNYHDVGMGESVHVYEDSGNIYLDLSSTGTVTYTIYNSANLHGSAFILDGITRKVLVFYSIADSASLYLCEFNLTTHVVTGRSSTGFTSSTNNIYTAEGSYDQVVVGDDIVAIPVAYQRYNAAIGSDVFYVGIAKYQISTRSLSNSQMAYSDTIVYVYFNAIGIENDTPYVMTYVDLVEGVNRTRLYNGTMGTVYDGTTYTPMRHTVSNKTKLFFVVWNGSGTYLMNTSGSISKTYAKDRRHIVFCSTLDVDENFYYYDGDSGQIIGEHKTFNLDPVIVGSVTRMENSCLALVFDTFCLVAKGYISAPPPSFRYTGNIYTAILTPLTRYTPIDDDSFKVPKDTPRVMYGTKEGLYANVLDTAPVLDVEIDHGPGVLIFGGVAYSGVVVSGMPTGWNQGRLWISNFGEISTYSSVVLDSTHSYIMDTRAYSQIATSGLVASGTDMTYKRYVMITQPNEQVLDGVTQTTLQVLDITNLTSTPETIYTSGIFTDLTDIETFSGYANHVEASNYGDVPYLFVSISGSPPDFYQKDTMNYDDPQTEFVQRITSIPSSNILCIRCDDVV